MRCGDGRWAIAEAFDDVGLLTGELADLRRSTLALIGIAWCWPTAPRHRLEVGEGVFHASLLRLDVKA